MRVQWRETVERPDHFLGPLLATSGDFFSLCHKFSQLSATCWPWLDREGGLSSGCSESGDNPGERLWRTLCGGQSDTVGGQRGSREELSKGGGVSWNLENGSEPRGHGREGPFWMAAAGERWERRTACHPQKHLDRYEPVLMRQCAHLFSQ